MDYILSKTLESISSLQHFYEMQKDYINRKSKKGMKESQTGFLIDIYLNVLAHGTEEDKNRKTFKSLEKFAEKYVDVIEVKENSVTYRTKTEMPNITICSKNYRKFMMMPSIHIDNTVVMLVTRFEEFISDYIRYFFLKFPQRYLDNQTIKFSDISEQNYNGLKEKVVNREIDEIMRKSYMVWFEMFEEHNLDFECCKSELEFLKELYASRNIIVHNSGIVNEQYIKNVENTNYHIGDKIDIDDSYVLKAFECIKTIVFCIYIEGIRIEKNAASKHVENVFNAAFEELSNKHFRTSKTVFYSLYKSNFSDEITKNMSRVNCWIARIELEGLDEVKNEIENFDVSALKKEFLLAKNILLSNYKDATNVLEEMYQNNEISSLEIENWPLFSKYKNSKEYSEFKKAHPELINVSIVETDSDTTIANKETTESVKMELKDVSDNEEKS